MEVNFPPEIEKQLNELAEAEGCEPGAYVADAMAGYLDDLAEIRNTLDSRYDDIVSGRVKPIGMEEARHQLRNTISAIAKNE